MSICIYHIILNWKQGLAIITQKQMLNESFYLFKFSICSVLSSASQLECSVVGVTHIIQNGS